MLLDIEQRDFAALSSSLAAGGPLVGERVLTNRICCRHRRNVRAVLLALHGPFCWLCDEEIVGETPTLDHVVPRSKGGRHAIVNLRLAHEGCNVRRADGPIPELLLTRVLPPDNEKEHGTE